MTRITQWIALNFTKMPEEWLGTSVSRGVVVDAHQGAIRQCSYSDRHREGAWTSTKSEEPIKLIFKNRRHFLPRSESTFKGRVIIYVMLDVMLDVMLELHLTEQSFILITRN